MCAARVHAGEEISINDVQMLVVGEQSGAMMDNTSDEIVLRTRFVRACSREPLINVSTFMPLCVRM